MAIKISIQDGQRVRKSDYPVAALVDIIADTVADISALTDTVTDGSLKIKAEPGSMAWTADMSAVYQLSPSKKWTKIGG